MTERKKDEKKITKRSLPKEVKVSVRAGKAKKGERIVVIRLKEISSFTDYFIIMNGNSARQNRAIYENIEKELKKENILPLHVEGKENAEWILMDYGSFILHIFSKETREYYSLEKLWGDGPKLFY
ncbi:MAG TPA: ribosome silencing factor [Candidatus Aminicenantes bacterium]|nr:ribosome silencing factor [Candidatus Aminicenantes bacterium]